MEFTRQQWIAFDNTLAKIWYNMDLAFEKAAREVQQYKLANIQKPKTMRSKKQRRCMIL